MPPKSAQKAAADEDEGDVGAFEGDESGKMFAKMDPKAQERFVDLVTSLSSGTADDRSVRFFKRAGGTRGAWYSVHGPHAEMIAIDYLKSAALLRMIGAPPKELPSVAINLLAFPDIVRDLLLEKNFRVEVYDQTAGGAWKVVQKASPGNTADFDDILSSDDLGGAAVESAVVCAVRPVVKGTTVSFGCAVANSTTRSLCVVEFEDSERQYLNLETFLIQMGVKECLVPAAKPKDKKTPEEQMSADDHQLADTLARCGVVRSPVPHAKFASNFANLSQDLEKLLVDGEEAVRRHLTELEMKLAGPALAALLDFLDLGSQGLDNSFTLKTAQISGFMKIDASGARALNLFGGKDSIYGLLNLCRTPMGSRQLRQYLVQPLVSLEDLTLRQNLTAAFFDDQDTRQTLREEVLKNVPDLDALIRKLRRGKAGLKDTLQLKRFCGFVPGVIGALEAYEGEHQEQLDTEFTTPLRTCQGGTEMLEKLIDTTLDSSDPNDVCINPNFDDDLGSLAEQKIEVRNSMNKCMKRVLRDSGLDEKTVRLEEQATLGHYFRVPRSKETVLKGTSSIRIIETKKDGIKFTTTFLNEANTQWKTVKAAYSRRASELEAKYMETVSSYVPLLEDIREILTLIDVFTSFAEVAASASPPYVRPELLPPATASEGHIQIEGGRHPLLENLGASVVPNSVEMDKANKAAYLITGPNMGGKSTFIRMVGAIQHLAQIGMFVPAKRASLSLCDAVLARVGATDYMSRGVSTFMAEMLEVSAVLQSATPASLLIVDELGRGTSTYDGFGLAKAIMLHIARKLHSFCLFATHFHELTLLERSTPSIGNLHVTADTSHGAVNFLYEVRAGGCSKSFGIHVAQLAGFPASVLEVATRKASELEAFDDEALSEDVTASVPSDESSPIGSRKRKLGQVVSEFVDRFKSIKFDETATPTLPSELLRLVADMDEEAGANPSFESLLHPSF